ncbi:TatA/E family twin arginine-targeting protein translocase [Thermocoleostomius sinensis]|nr:TatA/E family twin arginine-targeting protein translocase [Thermocoleostomius sinensis]
MNFFNIGLPEMALILVLALLIFGPKKLPEIGRSLGKAIRGFQEASKEFETEFKKEADRLEKTVNQPMKATLETPEPKALAPTAAETTTETESVGDASVESSDRPQES